MKKWMIAVIAIAVVAVSIFMFTRARSQQSLAEAAGLQTVRAERGSLTATVGATGIVRSSQSAILNWQTSGTVGEVNVKIGDAVSAGDVLASLEQTSLPQNVILAQADLVAAQKALDDLLNSDAQRAQAQQAVEEARRALEDAQNPELAQANALQAVVNAEKALEIAERNLRWAQSPAKQTYIDEAEAEVVLARDALKKAQERFAPYSNKPEDNVTRARLQSELATAQQRYDLAVQQLNSLQGTANETDQSVLAAEVETARAQLLEAQREYDRVKNGAAPADIALLQAQLTDAEREYERLKDGPPAEDLEAARARVAAAQATLNQARLLAPFAGVVTDVICKPGDQVIAGNPAFRIDDLSRLLIDVQVSEVDINRISEGQDVQLVFDAIQGKEYHGIVSHVSLVGSNNQGVVDFTVTVELLDADASVKTGMTAAVNMVVNQLEDVLLVPNRAVRVLNGKRVVYVLRGAVPEPVEIQLGASSELESEVIASELEVGDQIVLNPPATFGNTGGPGFMR